MAKWTDLGPRATHGWLALLAATSIGCAAPSQGEERGPCYPNGTCNAGLSCYSNACVRDVLADAAPPTDGINALDAPVDTTTPGMDTAPSEAAAMDVVPDASERDATPEPDSVDVPADAPADAPPVCTATHPLVDGGARYCGAGDCYCPSPGALGDSCLPQAVAASCCTGRTVTCAGGDSGVACPSGTHPLLDAGARYCAPGACYCPAQDNCRPATVAAACCPVAVRCP